MYKRRLYNSQTYTKDREYLLNESEEQMEGASKTVKSGAV
jgi:hypothetical protein